MSAIIIHVSHIGFNCIWSTSLWLSIWGCGCMHVNTINEILHMYNINFLELVFYYTTQCRILMDPTLKQLNYLLMHCKHRIIHGVAKPMGVLFKFSNIRVSCGTKDDTRFYRMQQNVWKYLMRTHTACNIFYEG